MASARTTSSTAAMDRALELLAPTCRPAEPSLQDGYLDLLGEVDAIQRHPNQRTMANRFVPPIYERFSRPLLGRLLMGVKGPGTRGEHRLALEMLSPLRTARGCWTSPAGRATSTRLRGPRRRGRAGRGHRRLPADARLRGAPDRAREHGLVALRILPRCPLPRVESFDAICSLLGALHLFKEPWQALDENGPRPRPGRPA